MKNLKVHNRTNLRARGAKVHNRTNLRARGAKDEDGVAVEVPPGSVIFFDNRLLHKSTDNHSGRFRRCSVAHYISADAERLPYKNINHIKPVMWVRGDTYSEKMEPVYQNALPIPEEQEN